MSGISPKVDCTPSHEHAEIFPLNEGESLWDLGKRIAANGLREPIVLLGKKILDGRRRELACIKEGVRPQYRDFGSRRSDGDDPLEFVIDMNLHRRHLGDGDRKLAAARYASAKSGKPCQIGKVSPTREDAAEKFEVSARDVDRAKVVLANGTPKLQAAVADDTIKVSDAAKVASKPPSVQNKAVAAVRSGKARTAAAAAAPRQPKSGSLAFDDRKIPEFFGKVVRLFHERAKAYPNSKGFKDVKEALNLVEAAWSRWHLETTGKKR